MNNNNKKIALNTVYMYARLIITMLVGLYTSRITLQILGVSDFGLFNVVGGVLVLFTFISGSLSVATSRFFNAEMGRKDGDVNRSFNVNKVLHIVLAVIVFVLGETFGLWYICNKLSVSAEKLDDAIFVYQIALLTSCAGILNTPYASLFQSHEKFALLSIIDIFNTFLRLGCIIILQYYDGDSLRFYSLIMSLTTANSFIIFRILSQKWWPDIIKKNFVFGWKYYKDILSFSNWNLLGTVSTMARSTGTDLLVNAFFGTAVNGAFAISKTINNYVIMFSANFDGASGPQIIQSYSSGNMERCNYLVNKMGRFTLLLFEIAFFTLYVDLDLLLHLWLKNVPEGVLLYSKLNLILAGVSLSGGGIAQLINASGKIKEFKIYSSVLFLLCIPIGYILFENGFPAYTMFILFTLADILWRIVQLFLLKNKLNFDSISFVKEAYARPFLVAIIMTIVVVTYSHIGVPSTIFRILFILFTFILVSILVLRIGVTDGEREKILTELYRKLFYFQRGKINH